MKKLTEGFKRFAARANSEFYSGLMAGQHPSVLVISCSDSRIVPEHIFDSQPGEIFVLRNMGNLARTEESSVRSCIDYAVGHLGVKSIVVLAHAGCGAVNATKNKKHLDTESLVTWLEQEEYDGDDSETAEKAQAVRQLEKLAEYPVVKEAIETGRLDIHALYFRLDPISLEICNEGGWDPL